FESRPGHAGVGGTCSSSVEPNEVGEGRVSFEEVGRVGVVPEVFDIGYEPRYVDQIAGPVTDHLVGDVDLAAPRVFRLGSHGEGSSSTISYLVALLYG